MATIREWANTRQRHAIAEARELGRVAKEEGQPPVVVRWATARSESLLREANELRGDLGMEPVPGTG